MQKRAAAGAEPSRLQQHCSRQPPLLDPEHRREALAPGCGRRSSSWCGPKVTRRSHGSRSSPRSETRTSSSTAALAPATTSAAAGAYIVGGKPPPGIPRGGFFIACANYGNPVTTGHRAEAKRDHHERDSGQVHPTRVARHRRRVPEARRRRPLRARRRTTRCPGTRHADERDAHRHVRTLHPDRPTSTLTDPGHVAPAS